MMLKCATCLVAFLGLLSIDAFRSTKEPFTRISTQERIIYDVEYSKAGKVLLIADGTTVKWHSSKNYELLASSVNGHSKNIMTINLSNDSTWLVSGGKDSTIVLWNVVKNQIAEKLHYHNGIITTLKFSPDTKYILSGSTDGKVILYDRVNQTIKGSSEFKGDITSVAISPDQKTFCLGGANGVSIHDFDTGSIIKTSSTDKWVREVAYSRNGEKIIYCGDNSNITIWSIKDLERINGMSSSKFTNDWLCSIKWNEDNQTFVTGGSKGVIKISTPFGGYLAKIGVMANDIEFTPNNGINLKIVIATHGKGVVICDAEKMTSTKQ